MCWITPQKRDAIYRRDNYTCGYCGRNYSADRSRLSLDHITPRAQGGSNQPTNLVTACDDCNNRKRNRTLGEYLEYLRVHVRRVVRVDIIKKRVNSMRRRKLIYE